MRERPSPDELIATALGRTAELLEDRFPAGHALKEKQFEQCFEAALKTVSAARILPSANLKLTHWRKAYAIDTMAMLPGGHTLAAELKWGVGTLYNCSWDLAKLGVALGEAPPKLRISSPVHRPASGLRR